MSTSLAKFGPRFTPLKKNIKTNKKTRETKIKLDKMCKNVFFFWLDFGSNEFQLKSFWVSSKIQMIKDVLSSFDSVGAE